MSSPIPPPLQPAAAAGLLLAGLPVGGAAIPDYDKFGTLALFWLDGTMKQLTIFDYQQLDQEIRNTAQKIEADFDASYRAGNEAGKKALNHWAIAGQHLKAMRLLLSNERPGFESWYTSKGLKKTDVYRLIHISEWFESCSDLEQLSNSFESLSALTELTAPSTSDYARQEAIRRASLGEVITHDVAKQIINGNKPTFDYDEAEDEGTEEEVAAPACGWLFSTDAPIEVYTSQKVTKSADSSEKPPNYKRDAKASREADIYTPQGYDACQTPPYAIDPLLPYLPDGVTIWEPAAGEYGIVEALYDSGFEVIPSDILTDQNFFEFEPEQWDIHVTNPPYSIKFKWLERCYEFGKPFALLLPVETLGAQTAQRLFEQHGLELILLDKRVNFKMPNAGWSGGGAQFPVAWFTWGLGIGQGITYGKINDEQLANWNQSIQERQGS